MMLMMTQWVALALKLFLGGSLGGFALLVIYQACIGRIALKGLISGPDGAVSPARLQLLLSTVLVLGSYLFKVASTKPGTAIPDINPALLTLMGGSHAAHLVGKAMYRFRGH